MGMKQSCVTSVGVWNLSIPQKVTRVQTSHLILWPFFPFSMTDMMDFKETFRNPFIKEATKVGKDFQPHETLRSHARKATVWSVTPVLALALMLSPFIKRNFIQTNNAKDGILKTINQTLFFQNCSKHFYRILVQFFGLFDILPDRVDGNAMQNNNFQHKPTCNSIDHVFFNHYGL